MREAREPYPTDPHGRPAALVALIACLLLPLAACGEEERAPAEGRRVTVVERYGADDARGVSVSATLVEDGTQLTLEDVAIELVPGDRSLVRKLEAVLTGTVLRRDVETSWPTPVAPLPDEAVPALSRLQLAVAVLDGDRSEDHATLALFADAPSMGLSRVVRDGDAIEVHALALAITPGGGAVATGHVRGKREGGSVELSGSRVVLGGSSEPVRISVRARRAGASGG